MLIYKQSFSLTITTACIHKFISMVSNYTINYHMMVYCNITYYEFLLQHTISPIDKIFGVLYIYNGRDLIQVRRYHHYIPWQIGEILRISGAVAFTREKYTQATLSTLSEFRQAILPRWSVYMYNIQTDRQTDTHDTAKTKKQHNTIKQDNTIIISNKLTRLHGVHTKHYWVIFQAKI